jgi:hypothetical protein
VEADRELEAQRRVGLGGDDQAQRLRPGQLMAAADKTGLASPD